MPHPAPRIRLAAAVPQLDALTRGIDTRPVKGRLVRAVGTILHAAVSNVRIGELCRLDDPGSGATLMAEVVGLTEDHAILTPIGDVGGLSMRTIVGPTGRTLEVPVGDGLLGRVLDGLGRPVDGGAPDIAGGASRPVHGASPPALSRRLIERPLGLGIRAIDGLLTCGEGQRIGIYGEPGGGKSSLLAQIVNGAEADVAVVGLIGERGREVREFIERHLDVDGRARSVVVAATSDRPAMERVAAAHTATAVAEHFRDQGRRVLLIMDSVTRFARALREIGLAAGEPPTRRGFPPSVFAALPKLLERTGPGADGSITAFYSVLVEGDGSGDPIAEETRGILDGHLVLSAKLGNAGHYPAIDVLASRSRVMDAVTGDDHRRRATRFRELLARYDEIEFLIQVGEYRPGSDPLADEAAAKIDDMRRFLRQGSGEFTPFAETASWMTRLVG